MGLRRIVELNEHNMKKGYFQLRWHVGTEGELTLLDGDGVFYRVAQNEPNQLYFMLAFPVMVLLELASTRPANNYRSSALALLDYLRNCQGVLESPMAHKFARAAAMASDKKTAMKIANFFLSQQTQVGNYQADSEAMDSIDQTAEIAVWLRQISKDLRKK